MAKFEDRRDFLRRAWPHDTKRLAVKEIARLVQKPLHPSGIGDDMVFADDGLEARDDVGISHSWRGRVVHVEILPRLWTKDATDRVETRSQ